MRLSPRPPGKVLEHQSVYPPAAVALFLGMAGWMAGCDRPVAFPTDGASWPAAPVPSWAHQARLALSDNGDDTLSFVSLDQPPRLLGLVPVGDIPVELEGPHHLAASPDGQTLYVGLSNFVPGSGTGPHGSHGLGTVPGSLLKLRAADGVKLAEVEVDRNPGDVILSRDGKTAYVSHFDSRRFMDALAAGTPPETGYSAIAIIDTAAMARPVLVPVCPTAHGVKLSSDEKSLFASCSYSDELAVLDLTTRTAHRVPVGPTMSPRGQSLYGPYAVAVAPADGSVWVSCTQSNELRVYDPKTDKMDPTRVVRLQGSPYFGVFRADGKTLVVPEYGSEALTLVDTSNGQVLRSIPLSVAGGKACRYAHAAMLLADDKTAYVVCEGEHPISPGTVVLVDIEAQTVIAYTPVGIYPDGIVLLPPTNP